MIGKISLSVNDYITKPLDLKELKNKIERILDYRSFINPQNIILIYRTLHNAILTFMQDQGRPAAEDPHQALKETDKTIDHFFRAQKEWERVLLIQKEALGKVAVYAEQLKEVAGENSSQRVDLASGRPPVRFHSATALPCRRRSSTHRKVKHP